MWRLVKDDPPPNRGCVLYARRGSEIPWVGHADNPHQYAFYWQPIEPIPKIWRTPTQADIDAATEAIPCRVRGGVGITWVDELLTGIAKFSEHKFVTRSSRWKNCEIAVPEGEDE